MIPESCLITVGYRSGAYEALEKMNLKVLLVNPSRAPKRHRHLLVGQVTESWQRTPALLDRVRQEMGARQAVGVLALTEGSVGVAAALRRGLGLAGVSPEIAHLGRDKLAMKAFFREQGIAVTDWLPIHKGISAADLAATLGWPVVVKQRSASGSRGLAIARDMAELKRVARPGWVAERFVTGWEMSIESFVAGENILLANPTEYLEPLWANLIPHSLDEEKARAVVNLNRRVLAALDFPRGMTHLELFWTSTGPVLGEIALRPPGGHLMELLALAYDFDPWETAIRLELGQTPNIPRRPRRFAGMRVLHPGAGIVRSVNGLEQARATEGVAAVTCKVKSGKNLEPRVGSGQEAGYILAAGERREDVIRALDRAQSYIRFDLEN